MGPDFDTCGLEPIVKLHAFAFYFFTSPFTLLCSDPVQQRVM